MTRLSSILFFATVVLSACGGVDAPVAETDGTDEADLRRLKQSRRVEAVADAGHAPVDAGNAAPDAGHVTPDAGHVMPDAGHAPPDAGHTVPVVDAGAPTGHLAAGWLYTQGNKIYVANGTGGGALFKGRGANIHDTRSCWACAYEAPNVGEVTRRIDMLTDGWKANFIRVDMESYTDDPSQVNGVSITGDSGYLADIEEIVRYATAKGVYVELSMWHDPSLNANGWPTSATAQKWAILAERFADDSHVLFGISNEPVMNYDGAQDAQVWTAMNETLTAIRAVEDARGVPHHIVVAQGTGGWSRFVQYYTTHPLPGGNVAYEIHAYNPQGDFASLVTGPANTIPVIIGEFGPVEGTMTLADASALIDLAMQKNIPYLAWTFHHRCPPNLLVDNSNGTCGVGMNLQPTAYGTMLKNKLALPW